MKECKVYLESEIGLVEIEGGEGGISSVRFVEEGAKDSAVGPSGAARVVIDCARQLDEYFRGERQDFALKLRPAGTAFQQRVWQQVATIPYGQTVSYLEVAQMIGDAQAVRAVGAANGQNPMAIIIPCHRVVGSDGSLTGYGGGLWRKAWLLNHERRFSSGQLALF